MSTQNIPGLSDCGPWSRCCVSSCTDRWAGLTTRPLCQSKTNGALSRGSVHSLESRFSSCSSYPASPTQRLCFLSPFYAPQHLAQSWAHHRMCPKSIFEKSSKSTWSCHGPALLLYWDWLPGPGPLLTPPTRLWQCSALPQAWPGQTLPRSLPSQVTPVRVHYSLSWQAHPVPHNLKPIKAREAPVVMEASFQSGSP